MKNTKKLLLLLFLSTNLCATPYIDTEKYEYNTGETIYIHIEELLNNKEYWLGVYPNSSGRYWKDVVSWPLGDVKNGIVQVESINEPGKYVAKLFHKGTYKILDQVKFDVNSDRGTTENDCGSQWYNASLTNYTSYPKQNSQECKKYNGCKWAGQFYGLAKKKSKTWVKEKNIVAVHIKDWEWLALKKVRIRKGEKEIVATVYDACSDSDCDGCCTNNLGNNDLLIDMEKYTKDRFGADSGTVEFQVCN